MKINLLSLLAVTAVSVAMPCNPGSDLGGESARMDKNVAMMFPFRPAGSRPDGVAMMFPFRPAGSRPDGVAMMFPFRPAGSRPDGVAC